MPDIIITPSSGIIDFFPVSTRVGRIEGSGNTINIVNPSGFVAVSGSGLSINSSSPNATFHAYSATSGATLLNIEGTNGSLFSVIDNLSGTLMSVNNNAGLPVFEVFSDDRVVAGRFGQNDFAMTSGGNIGIGTGVPSSKFHVLGTSTFNGDVSSTGSFIAGSGSAGNPSFEFTGDADTGLFSPAANTIALSTSGVERVRIDNIGNVGIGNSPQNGFKLDVQGASVLRGQMNIGGGIVGQSTDFAAIRYNLSSTANSNSYSYVCNGGGNFGIGFPSPSGRVAISGGASIGSNYNLTPPTNGLIIEGNVGIGTTTPSGQLHVIGSGLFASGLAVTGLITSNSGNFTNSLQVNGTGVSISGHTHTSSNITDFNTSVSGLINGIYAPLSSPTLTGVPLTPTASSGTNTNQIASTSFVRTEISNLVNSAPATLDTLNELALALGSDANFSTTVASGLGSKAALSGAIFTGNISAPSGNFTSLTASGIPLINGGYDYEIHVSQIDGNDTTGNGDLLNPVASITKALTLVGSQRKTIIVHPGTYTENPSITVQYTTITGPGLIGGNIVISGTLSTNTGCTIAGIKMTNLTIATPTGAGNVNILNCEISGTLTKSSNADYTVLRLCDYGSASITGAGLVAIFGGNPNFTTVNNASANIIIKSAVTVAPVLTSGTLSLVDSIVVAAVTNAITSASSSVITLANCQMLTSALSNVAPVVLSGFYSILNCVYDKTNSTLVALSATGGSTNSIDYFQYINADKFITQGGTSSQYLKGDGSLALFPDNIVYTSGNQTISGVKTFSDLPFVNGTGVSISGHTHTVSNITNFGSGVSGLLPSNLVYTTGTQSVGGVKTFNNRPVFNSGITLSDGLPDVLLTLTHNSISSTDGASIGISDNLSFSASNTSFNYWSAGGENVSFYDNDTTTDILRITDRISVRSPNGLVSGTYFPVWVTNPSGSAQAISSRTAAELLGDIRGYPSSNPSGYTTNVGTVTSVAALTVGTTGTDITSTVATNTTTPVITLNIPTASASNRGVLSSTDWSTFNNKQALLTNPVTGTGTGASTSGYLPQWNSTSGLINSNIYQSGSNIGIGIVNPISKLHVAGDVLATGSFIAGSGTAGNPSFEFTGDPDTGLFSPAANTLGISTSGVERLRINNVGNVGIGTTNYAFNNLSAGGEADLSINSVAWIHNALQIGPIDNGFDYTWINNGSAIFNTLGVGEKVDTPGNAVVMDTNGLVVNNGGGNGGSACQLLGDYGAIIENTLIVNSNANGNATVGIGTATPSEALDVVGNININGSIRHTFAIPDASNNIAPITWYNTINDINSVIAQIDVSTEGSPTEGMLAFHTNGGSSLQERVRITDVGNVGIGTSSPSSKLHVAGDILATGSFIGGSGTAALPSFEFVNDPDTGMFSPSANTFGISTSGVERLRIDSVGRVGIGTSSPSSTLQVSGLITANSGNFTQSLQVNGTGVSISGHSHTSSDISNFNSSVSGLLTPYQLALTNPITGIGTSGYLTRWSGSNSVSSGIIFDNGTNVGIGTASPSGRLHVLGTGLVDGRLSISPTSAVTSPLSVLHVSGSVTNNASLMISGPTVTRTYLGVGNSDTIPFFSSLNGDISASTYGWGFFDRGTDGFLNIQRKGGASSWSSVMTMDRTNGNVGIGTGVQATTPPEKLTVDGNIRLSDTATSIGNKLQFNRGGGTANDYTIGKEGNHLGISTANDGSTFRFVQFGYHSGATWTPRTVINGYTGAVGIGTTSPTSQLHVIGSGIIASGLSVSGSLNLNGSGVGLYDTSVFNLGTISGSNAINCGQDRQIQTLTLNGVATTFTTGTGWPSSSSVARETTLNIFSSGNTSITWTIVNDWYRQPDSPLPSGRHIVLLRSVGSGTMQGHYIGNKTN